MDSNKSEPTKQKQENVLVTLLINVIIPTVILIKFSGDKYLGPTYGLITALAFPISYGLYDLIKSKKVNFFSALGIVSVLLTGGIALLELPLEYIAIKEAAIPAILGIAVLISIKTPYPLVRTMLYNDKVVDVVKVDEALHKSNNKEAFEKVLTSATLMFSASFFFSSVMNYALAKYIIVSPPGTEEFNVEFGKMTALSYPVIAIPSVIILFGILFYLFRNITQLTHLKLEEIFAAHAENEDNTDTKENETKDVS